MPGRILIADDLATNRIVLKVKLSAASYDVRQANNRAELLDMAFRERPDLIILDGAFQNDRGIDLCHEIKDSPDIASIPVIIIATNFSPADRLAALNAGAWDVLTKPVNDSTLLARVRNTLRVRGIEEELRLRQGTALELGFHDAPAPFDNPAQVLVVNGASKGAIGWQSAFRTSNSCHIHMVGHAGTLDLIARKSLSPDVIVLPAQISTENDGLFLLAELRSRRETRHAAIIVVSDEKYENAAISALDMGANDVLDASTPAAEFAFRLTRQLERKLNGDRLRATLEDGLRMAVTDPLTGLFNRRYVIHHLKRIARNSAATGNSFAVMLLDLDRFKRINDTYGHGAGDYVLREIARRLKANVRSVDLIARIGGEEFLVVMPDAGLGAARIAAERLRRVTKEYPVRISHDSDPIFVTTSIGVSIGGLDGNDEATVETMVERADQALLGAKSTGRNQVIFEKSAA
jgi:two-component system, cell cycle response regulator